MKSPLQVLMMKPWSHLAVLYGEALKAVKVSTPLKDFPLRISTTEEGALLTRSHLGKDFSRFRHPSTQWLL